MKALQILVISPMCVMTLLIALAHATYATNSTTLEDDISKRLGAASDLNYLSRKRRYLQFPEGSSIQFVYNVVLGVIDYSNYMSVSLTVAMAYELPSKPPSELLESVKDHLIDGTFGINRKDTTADIKYVDINKKINKQKQQQITKFPQWIPFHKYYANKPLNYSRNLNPLIQYLRNAKQQHNMSWRRRNYYPIEGGTASGNNATTIRRFLLKSVPTEHRIYHVLGKRIPPNSNGSRRSRINNGTLSKQDRIHIRYQRSTRHSLYNAIETFLDRKNINGFNCVLRALCETGQKISEHGSGSFVAELMRALFTMPEVLSDEVHLGAKQDMYDAAHALKGNCSKRFSECGHSIWSSNFVK